MNDGVVKLRVLGGTAAEVNGRSFGPDATHVFAALLVLALEPQHRVTRQRLGALLWPDAPSNRRGERLRWLLSKMRGLDVPLDVTSVDVKLRASVIEVDYVALLSTLDSSTPDRFTLLDHIGGVLDDYAPDFSRAFRRWVDEQRESITDEMLTRLVPLLGLGRQRGDWAATDRIARAIRRMSRSHEEATLALAEALCATGDKANGIKILDDYLTEIADAESPLRLPAELLRRRISIAAPAEETAAAVPFVGRREHLHRFQTMFARVAASRGGALLVAGPSGIGKTRLLEETAAFASSVGRSTVIRVRCQPGDATRPLAGVGDVIAKLLELRGAAGCSPRTLQRLGQLGEVKESVDGELSSVPDRESHPAIRRDELREALLDLLAATSEEQTLVLQIDDFQWSDRSMDWLWTSVLPFASSHRLLWCFAARCETPQDMEALFAADVMPLVTRDWLTGLDVRDSGELLDGLLGQSGRASAAAARSVLLERGGGIPLVLLELVRHWQGTGELSTIPLTLAALMNARIARLSPAARRTLQVSGLLGTFSSIERLELVLQLPRPDFVDALATLEITGILTTDQSGMTHGHVLWAEAALAHLEPSVAHVLHRHIAEQFDVEMAAAPSSSFLWESARHWEQAGSRDRALSAIVRGAEHLARNGLYLEAAEVYGRAISQSGDAVEQLKFLRRRIALFRLSGASDLTAESIRLHESLAAAVDPLYDKHNELEMLKIQIRVESIEPLSPLLDDILPCARDERASSSHRLHASSLCARYAGEIDRHDVLREMHQILASLTPVTVDDRRRWALGEIAYHIYLGAQQQALVIAQDWLALESTLEDPYHLSLANKMVSWAGLVVGNLDIARQAGREAVRIAREAHLRGQLHSSHDHMIGIASDYEDPDVMRDWVDRAEMDYGDMTSGDKAIVHAMWRAHIAIELGDGENALRLIPLMGPFEFDGRTIRARFLSVPLAARLLVRRSSEQEAETHRLAQQLSACFDLPCRWMGWPAAVYAQYLDEYQGQAAADAFVSRFVREIFREKLPPRRLAPFVARLHSARALSGIRSASVALHS